MKKLLSLALALVMSLSLCVPALAAPDARPMWQQWGYTSLIAYLDETGYDEWGYYCDLATPAEQKVWTDAWFAAHPDVVFDANTYFLSKYTWISKDDFMRSASIKSDGDFVLKMAAEFVSGRQRWAVRYAQDYAWLVALGEAETFNPEAHYVGVGYEDKADYMRQNDLASEQEFYAAMLQQYRADVESAMFGVEQWQAHCVRDPEGTAQFLAQVDGLIVENGYTDLADYMAQRGFLYPEQAYADLSYNWFMYREEAERIAKRVTELGGVPGQINVLLNEKCLIFGGKLPTAKNGVLSVPADVLSKALGVAVTADADGYAPLRTNAEAAGCFVAWDGDHNTAVLIDRADAVAKIDSQFTKLGELWAGLTALYKRNEGQAYQIDDALTFHLTDLNSMDGDKTYTVKVKGTSTMRDGVRSASLTIDLAGVWKQLAPELKESILQNLPKKPTLTQMAQLMSGVKVDFILNPSEALYVKAPVLGSLLEGYEADSWVRVDLTALRGDAVTGPSLSVGALLYDRTVSGRGWDILGTYQALMDTADTAATFVGDERFAEQNGTLTYKLDANTVNDYIRGTIGTDGGMPIPDLFRAADVTATLGGGGKLTLAVDVRPNTDAYAAILSGGTNTLLYSWLFARLDLRFGLRLDAAADKAAMTMDFHWRNQIKADVSYTSTSKKTGATPNPVPPKGAKIKDWSDIRFLLPF